jgi:hypothetical protein
MAHGRKLFRMEGGKQEPFDARKSVRGSSYASPRPRLGLRAPEVQRRIVPMKKTRVATGLRTGVLDRQKPIIGS